MREFYGRTISELNCTNDFMDYVFRSKERCNSESQVSQLALGPSYEKVHDVRELSPSLTCTLHEGEK